MASLLEQIDALVLRLERRHLHFAELTRAAGTPAEPDIDDVVAGHAEMERMVGLLLKAADQLDPADGPEVRGIADYFVGLSHQSMARYFAKTARASTSREHATRSVAAFERASDRRPADPLPSSRCGDVYRFFLRDAERAIRQYEIAISRSAPGDGVHEQAQEDLAEARAFRASQAGRPKQPARPASSGTAARPPSSSVDADAETARLMELAYGGEARRSGAGCAVVLLLLGAASGVGSAIALI